MLDIDKIFLDLKTMFNIDLDDEDTEIFFEENQDVNNETYKGKIYICVNDGDKQNIKIVDIYDNDNSPTAETDYAKLISDIYHSMIKNNASSESIVKESVESKDESKPIDIDKYPILLAAIDSEKDAEITYKTLIQMEKESENPSEEIISLLEKILSDELEHIALLSALTAKNNEEYVGEDSKEDFDSYINAAFEEE